MEFLYEISANDVVIMSNFPDQYLIQFDIEKERVLSDICASTGKKIKHGFFQRKNYKVYLLTYDLNITNKIFRRYIDVCEFFILSYIDAEKK